jgi:DNA repair protein RecO (recombination protein O)
MEWTDDGVILSRRRLGEADAVVALFTRDHGRHLGLGRGGAGRRHAAALQLGTVVAARWRARLEDQLGWFACEPLEATAMAFLDDAGRLEAMTAALELLDATLPERQPHPELHAATRAFLGALGDAPAPAALLARWEVGVLAALGFGLDLTRCAATGAADDLAYVSPRSGRAVSRAGAGTLADRLLGLPAFLLDPRSPAEAADIAAALALTGHFVARHLLAPAGRSMPPARLRVVDRLARAARLRGP